tara:strand:- start:19698 stop:20306 length:609 start_codon:yes stop_codon:yes gene_type:complete
MTDDKKLTPLTPEASALFEEQRQSDAVLQSKCTHCGAWYETDKKPLPFKEVFECDCGSEMNFTVPAAPQSNKLMTADNTAILSVLDGEARLDTGMKIQEAVKRAAIWWEDTGRQQMQREQKRQSQAVGGSQGGAGGEFASKDATSLNYMPSGLIHGQPWEALGKRERIMVVKAWHHFFIRTTDLIGDDPRATHKMQDRGRVQ